MNEFKVTLIGDLHIEHGNGYSADELNIPQADLAIILGDFVQTGRNDEYVRAVKWAKKLKIPAVFVRGNHDNGDWGRYVPDLCIENIRDQLKKNYCPSRSDIVIWRPNIFEKSPETILLFSKNSTKWSRIPGNIQDEVIKRKNTSPAYYFFDAGGLRFICLDTSDWLLGKEQIQWLESQLAKAPGPVVLVGHHHFLPVGTDVDGAQVHEREFLRSIVLNNSKIIAYLCAHAHKDRWWRYGDTDIITTRLRTCRTVTFRDGRIIGSVLDGKPDSPETFHLDYMSTHTLMPGKFTTIGNSEFKNPWDTSNIACFGWANDRNEESELNWTMTLPEDISPENHSILFQLKNSAPCSIIVNAPGLKSEIIKDISPDTGQAHTVSVDIGPLKKGLIRARMICGEGWGYTASHASFKET